MLHSIDFKHFSDIEATSIPTADHIECISHDTYRVMINEKNYTIIIDRTSEKGFTAYCDGIQIEGKLKRNLDILIEKMGFNESKSLSVKDIAAPMPGLVLSIAAKPESKVSTGDPLLVLEAMKMENIVKSPVDGTILSVEVSEGDAVEKNQILIRFQ